MDNRIFINLILCFLYSSLSLYGQYCTNDNRFTEVNVFSTGDIDSIANIKYGEAQNAQGNLQDLLLDIYYPSLSLDTLTKRPLILFIHGGSFVSGNKRNMHWDCMKLAQKGFACATISYRLGKSRPLEPVYRAQQDALAALRFLASNATKYKIDKDNFFIGGKSAGSITAQYLIFADQSEWNSVAASVVNRLGALDSSGNTLTSTYTIKGLCNHYGNVLIPFLDKSDAVPTVSFHGEQDTVVSIDTTGNNIIGSRPLHNWLVLNSVCSDLTIDTAGGHVIYSSPQGLNFTSGKTSCFFKSIFCNQCSNSYALDSVAAKCQQSFLVGTERLATTERAIKVYPNPFSSGLSIEGVGPDTHLTLFNARGGLVAEGPASSLSTGLGALAKGFYFLKIKVGDELLFYKLLKQ